MRKELNVYIARSRAKAREVREIELEDEMRGFMGASWE